jgi:hypothetical protein
MVSTIENTNKKIIRKVLVISASMGAEPGGAGITY